VFERAGGVGFEEARATLAGNRVVTTHAILAVFRVDLGAAAVAPVPVTTTHVVVVVTETITFVRQLAAITRAFFVFGNVWIEAQTRRAIGEATHFFIRDDAAVTTVPVTTAIVVFVVAVLVAFVIFESTATLAFQGLLGRVLAAASVAETVVVFGPAAIPPVPIALTNVVEIITITILVVIGKFAFGFW